MKFIIEHLEPELFEWCQIEYSHISKIAGMKNLVFTNIKKKDFFKLEKLGAVYEKDISALELRNVCVLSQYAEKTLKAADKNRFRYLAFGGILGDNPAKKRTGEITNKLKSKKMEFEERNLGDKQMPTDIAVFVAKKILEGAKFCEMKFCDNIEIEINENESIVLPFRHPVVGGRLIINEKLVDYLRKRKDF